MVKFSLFLLASVCAYAGSPNVLSTIDYSSVSSLSIGNHGQSIYAGRMNADGFYYSHSSLFSTHQTNHDAIWRHLIPGNPVPHAVNRVTRVAKKANVIVEAFSLKASANDQLPDLVLRKYDGGSNVPEFSVTLETVFPDYYDYNMQVSNDGKRVGIVYYKHTQALGGHSILVMFDENNQPTQHILDYGSIGSVYHFSENLKRVMVSGASLNVYDTENGSLLDSISLFNTTALVIDASAKGDVIATSAGDGHANSILRVFRANESNHYQQVLTAQAMIGSQPIYCPMIRVSPNGRYFAYACDHHSPSRTLVERVDLDSASLPKRSHVIQYSNSTLEPQGLDYSQNGETLAFVLGSLNNPTGPSQTSGFYVFDHQQSAPIYYAQRPGYHSLLQLSLDGKYAATNRRHAVQPEYAVGLIDIIRTRSTDLDLTSGVPRANTTATMELQCSSGEIGGLIVSNLPRRVPPKTFPNIGTIHINRRAIIEVMQGTPIGGNRYRFNRTLPAENEFISFQGLCTTSNGHRMLSEDYLALTAVQ